MTSLSYGPLTLLVFLTCLSATLSSPESTLRHVNLLYRHGDRSPIEIYPTDINQIGSWPDGLGWLTNIGKQQQYELGQYLRGRYGGFINVTHYDHRQIAVRASAIERCLMSAYSNLAGFFPPQGDQMWDPNLPWQPIPVKSVPEEQDYTLAMSKKCPRYDELLAKEYSSKRTLDFLKANQDLLELLAKNTWYKKTFKDAWRTADTLYCEKSHNMTWNSWVTPRVFERAMSVLEFGWTVLYHTPEMAKFKGGPLLKEMIENMKASRNGTSGDLKFHMYSAHDSTVVALLTAMKVYNKLQPPYRALVMVELHKINSIDVVKIFYRNDTTKEPIHLVPAGCEDPCKLTTLLEILYARIPLDWEEECKPHNSAMLRFYSGPLIVLPFLMSTLKLITLMWM